MLSCKKGVSIIGLKPELLVGIHFAERIWEEHGQVLTVTAVVDGVHTSNSFHYKGLACDLRTKDLPDEPTKDSIFAQLQTILIPLGFDVLLEDRGGVNEHIHLEFDPT
jgi:hypothetical protein